MTDETPQEQSNSAVEANLAKSAGQMLRSAREAQGIHVASLAVSIKVPVKKLEALEADRLDLLPDAVFTRALASSVCRVLKIDAQPILQALPQLNTRVLDEHPMRQSGSQIKLRGQTEQRVASSFSGLNRTAVFGVLALLMAALILLLLPDFKSRMDTANESASPAQNSSGVSLSNTVNVPSTPVTDSGSIAPAAMQAKPLEENAKGKDSQTSLSLTPALSTPQVPSPTLTISGAGIVPSLPANSPAPDSLIIFTATGQTWVEVRDAQGKIQLQRIMQAGEQVGAKGATPLSVVIGRANLAQVSVRGKIFDLAPHSSKDLVARFQVK